MENPEHHLIDPETVRLFGGEVREIHPADDGLEVQLALRTIRDHLLSVAERDGVGVNQLARRLDISPSSVSRFFSNDGDIRVSTAVLYARALGCYWDFGLSRDAACTADRNHSGRPEIIHDGSLSANTPSTSTYLASVPLCPRRGLRSTIDIKATA
jgi:transcriptional regulator with XRE-family HTH domain